MGPFLKRRCMEWQENKNTKLNKIIDPLLDIRLCVKNPAELYSAGFNIRSINGPYLTAYVPISRLDELSELPSVEYIREASKCYLHLDQSMPEIGMDIVRTGHEGTGYTGNDVIIGVIDTGIDWMHEDFIDAEGFTRILAIWDQTLDVPNGPFHIFAQDHIQAAIDQNDYASVGGKDLYGHGTHVAGIAAGSGSATGNNKSQYNYIGAAPDAKLIIVKVSDGISMTDSQVEDGLNFIFQKADEFGLPCVVNLSLGRRNGSHDGRDSFELGMNNFLASPGRAIVVSAGNDGGKRIHVQHEFNPFITDTLNVEIQISENDQSSVDQVSFEGWIHHLSPVEITIVNPQGVRFGPISPEALYRWPENETTQIYVDNGSSGEYVYNGDKQILIQLMDGEQRNELLPGKWILKFHNGSDRLDLWLVDHSISAEIVSEIDETTLLNEPAHALLVVTVGSYVSRTEWPNLWSTSWKPEGLVLGALSSISSPGPSRRNSQDNHTRNKPEIVAPGEYIVSSHSQWSAYWPGDQYMASDSVHRAWTGTSFAAPHVTGLIACMFEQDPTLSANSIKGKLLNTKKDEFTGYDTWNSHWGFGKIDAAAAMGLSSVNNQKTVIMPNRIRLLSNYPNPFNSCTMIQLTADEIKQNLIAEQWLKIYDVSGKLIRSIRLPLLSHDTLKIQWDGRDSYYNEVPSGVYFATLNIDQKYHSKKMILIR
ncbi:S8 family serine peptidase [bacterium]